MRRRDIPIAVIATTAGVVIPAGAEPAAGTGGTPDAVDSTYPQTSSEKSANVTPANYAYPAGAIERYYSGEADARPAIQAALNANSRVYSFYQHRTRFPVSDYLLVPAGVALEDVALLSTGHVSHYSKIGAAHQGQMVILSGDRACARRLMLDGGNNNAGGVVVFNCNGNEVAGCTVSNTGKSQAVLVVNTTQTRVIGNYLEYTSHGVQHWQCVGCTITGNVIRNVSGGGIWGTDSTDVSISGNSVCDCGDVGIDLEGGVNCQVTGNAIRRCKNGELAWFRNGTGSKTVPSNCLYSGNALYRAATFNSWDTRSAKSEKTSPAGGAIFIASITPGQSNICFSGNSIQAEAGTVALYTNDLGANDCGINLSNNDITTAGLFHNIQRAHGIIMRHNTFIGLAGAEGSQNQLKNCSGALLEGNLYQYSVAKTANYALSYYTDAAIQAPPRITGNTFVNCNSLAFNHDPYVSGVGAVLSDNQFTDACGPRAFQPNGGINVTGNGPPLARGQKLFLRCAPTLDLAKVGALRAPNVVARGRLVVLDGGTAGPSYDIMFTSKGPSLVSRDGQGPGSGIPPTVGSFATFSGTLITVSAPGSPLGHLELEITSFG
jgi:parallel beta-helix repeat protein